MKIWVWVSNTHFYSGSAKGTKTGSFLELTTGPASLAGWWATGSVRETLPQKIRCRGWRVSSRANSIGCSRVSDSIPNIHMAAPNTSNSISRGCGALFWSPRALHARGVQKGIEAKHWHIQHNNWKKRKDGECQPLALTCTCTRIYTHLHTYEYTYRPHAHKIICTKHTQTFP